MKKINTKSSLFKIVICLAICAVCVGIGVAAGVFSSVGSAFSGIRLNLKSLLNLIVMAAFVMAAENVVLLFPDRFALLVRQLAARSLVYLNLLLGSLDEPTPEGTRRSVAIGEIGSELFAHSVDDLLELAHFALVAV